MVKQRVYGLDVLRALAISLVVLSHSTYLLFPSTENSLIKVIRLCGAIGVDLFFVLSGFLIGGILLRHIKNGKTRFKNLLIFWKRRWYRTLPNYFLALILNIIVLKIFNIKPPENIGSYFVFLQNFTSLHPDFFTEAWSLSIEEYAYLLLPLVLYFSFYVFRSVNKVNLFLIITISIILILFYFKIQFYFSNDISSYKQWGISFRKVVIYRLDSIYVGFLVAFLVNKYSLVVKKYKHYFLFSGCVIFLILHLYIYYYNVLPENDLVFYTLVYLQIIVLSLSLLFPFFCNLTKGGFASKQIKFLSIHSYAIYLVNYSLILLPVKDYVNLGGFNFFEKVLKLFLFLMSTLILSKLIYTYFEKPILKFRDFKYKQ